MGNSSYDSNLRATRAKTLNYTSAPRDTIFTQQVKRMAHEQMLPRNVLFRESRDSAAHPNSIPVMLFLDVTGSMGHIPHEMIKNGLPNLMGALAQSGTQDVSLMFGAIGDHESDRFPLQIGQFESGDAELDMWLTRTYLEGNGGSNGGESYSLAWYFGANHVRTDAWEKRGKKGFLFTVGDEPCLPNLPVSAVRAIMGDVAVGQGNLTMEELLSEAEKTNHVYHIHVTHGRRTPPPQLQQLLGDHFIEITDPADLSKTISDIILSVEDTAPIVKPAKTSTSETSDDIYL